MNTQLLTAEVELLGRGWPEQRIPKYNDYFKIWLSQFTELRPRSIEHYQGTGKIWCAFANGKDLTPRMMIEWHVSIANRLSKDRKSRMNPCMVNKHNATVKRFLGWLKLVGVITHDPSIAVPWLKQPERLPPRPWLHEEYRKIIDYGNDNQHARLDGLVFLVVLGYHTGMGLVDCCYLRWEEVVLSEDKPSYIQKFRAKLGQKKVLATIPIVPGSELWVWMKRLEARRATNYKRHDGIEYVHQDLPGYYECPVPSIAKRLKGWLFIPAIGRDQMGNRSFRHFRNSFCSRLINSGSDALLVSKMSGHRDLSMLSSYVLPNLRAMQDALVNGMRWAEGESGPDLPRRFLTLPSSPEPNTSPPSQAAGQGGDGN